MSKNVSQAPQPMMAMEANVSNMEAKVKSGNLMSGAAYEAPMMNNQKRMAQSHIGNMPAPYKNGVD